MTIGRRGDEFGNRRNAVIVQFWGFAWLSPEPKVYSWRIVVKMGRATMSRPVVTLRHLTRWDCAEGVVRTCAERRSVHNVASLFS